MTWAGERSEQLRSFQSREMFFLLTLPFIERAYRRSLTTSALSNLLWTHFHIHSEECSLSSDFFGLVSMTTARL